MRTTRESGNDHSGGLHLEGSTWRCPETDSKMDVSRNRLQNGGVQWNTPAHKELGHRYVILEDQPKREMRGMNSLAM